VQIPQSTVAEIESLFSSFNAVVSDSTNAPLPTPQTDEDTHAQHDDMGGLADATDTISDYASAVSQQSEVGEGEGEENENLLVEEVPAPAARPR
jgi:hypothetical protein